MKCRCKSCVAASVAAAVTSLFFPRIPIGKAAPEGAGIVQPADISAVPPEA